MYTPFAYAFAYAIKQTPHAFVAKIILCMYLLYGVVAAGRTVMAAERFQNPEWEGDDELRNDIKKLVMQNLKREEVF